MILMWNLYYSTRFLKLILCAVFVSWKIEALNYLILPLLLVPEWSCWPPHFKELAFYVKNTCYFANNVEFRVLKFWTHCFKECTFLSCNSFYVLKSIHRSKIPIGSKFYFSQWKTYFFQFFDKFLKLSCSVWNVASLKVWINYSIVIYEKNGVLNAAGVCGSCNSSPRSRSRAETCWGTRKIRFLLLKRP